MKLSLSDCSSSFGFFGFLTLMSVVPNVTPLHCKQRVWTVLFGRSELIIYALPVYQTKYLIVGVELESKSAIITIDLFPHELSVAMPLTCVKLPTVMKEGLRFTRDRSFCHTFQYLWHRFCVLGLTGISITLCSSNPCWEVGRDWNKPK